MTVRLRDFELDDIMPIDAIFKRQPGLGVPGFKNMIANSTVVDDDGDVIGYGILKTFSEGVLILDRSRPKKEKAQAVKLTVEKAIEEAKKAGIEHLYFLTSNSSFADVLRKRWSFKNVDEEVLMLRLDDKEE